jgi:hypothetical protein
MKYLHDYDYANINHNTLKTNDNDTMILTIIVNDQSGGEKFRLQPHWGKSDLQSVTTSYDSLAAHNSAFFLLIVEECIESPSFKGDYEPVRL